MKAAHAKKLVWSGERQQFTDPASYTVQNNDDVATMLQCCFLQ